MSIVTDTLNRLQSARAQHATRSPKPQEESSEPGGQPSRPSRRPTTRRSKKFVAMTVLISVTLTAMGIAGYWWGLNYITGSSPLKQNTAVQETPEPNIRPVGLPSTGTDVAADAELTPDPETSLVQTHPETSTVTLTSLATASDSNPALPIAAPSGPSQSEGIDETPKTSPHTPIPSSKSSPPAGNVKGATKDSSPSQTQRLQPTPSSPVASTNQAKATRSRPDAKISQKSTTPEPSSTRVQQKQGQRDTSPVNAQPDRESGPSETPELKTVSTHKPMPTPTVARAQLPPQRSLNTSPRYSLTPKQRMTKGKFLIRKQLYEEAVKVLDPLFESHPSHWEPWFWMGTAYLGLRELELAESFLMEGLVRDDTVPHLWVQRGLVYQQQEKHEKAIGAFRQAERLAPDIPEVHLNLAHVLESQGNDPLALKHYRKYLALTDKALESRSLRMKVLDKIVGLGGPGSERAERAARP